jgi:hypothetical protein
MNDLLSNDLLTNGAAGLRSGRGLKITLIIGAAILLLLVGLSIWAASAAVGWLSNQAPVAKQMFSEQVSGAMAMLDNKAPELRQQLEGIAPGITESVQQWLPDKTSGDSDVPGEDLGAVARYEGLVRTMYVVEDSSRTVTFEGRANFRPVLEHYQLGFAEKGWTHRVLFAAAGEEKHEYSASDVRVKLHVKETGGAVQVAITEFATPQVDSTG